MLSHLARLTLTVSLVALFAACDSDPTNPGTGPGTGDLSVPDGTGSTAGVSSGVPCPSCTFEPKLYTRTTGIPVTEVIEFPGNPDGAYTLETDDLGTRGANSRLWLNGERMKTPDGLHRQEIVLGFENSLEVRLTGKPQSKLQVRVFQEVASVTVTPDSARARIPATQQFIAVARDRNGIEIPSQTFTWESANTLVATVDAVAGVASTVGEDHLNGPWSYTTTSTGEGQAQITAHADGSDKQGTAKWTVVQGFVYTTFRPPLPAQSRAIMPFRYDETRLNQMAETCATESSNTVWNSHLGGWERQFQQCYLSLKLSTPRRTILGVPQTPWVNVGLYGRYCGEGHPDGEFIILARDGDHEPKDPIDAVCMEHDRAKDHHGFDPLADAAQATCIVRWMIETEELHEEGVRIREDTHPERWDAFWSQWPDMAEAREHWLSTTKLSCFGSIYDAFLDDRNLTKPE